MTWNCRTLNDADLNELMRLFNTSFADANPYVPLNTLKSEDLLDPAHGDLVNPQIKGVFQDGSLRAAMKWGRAPEEETRDFGNLHGGSGVISWLVMEDEEAADTLYQHALPELGDTIYVFPEGGELGTLFPYHTGMLPVTAEHLVKFFEDRGFVIPEGETWGVQERICMQYDVPVRPEVPESPAGLELVVKAEGLSIRLNLVEERDNQKQIVAEAYLAPATIQGSVLEDVAYVSWLGVNESLRGRGIGGFLMQHLIADAAQAGARQLILTTHAGRPAWKLYERLGFFEVSRARSYRKTAH